MGLPCCEGLVCDVASDQCQVAPGGSCASGLSCADGYYCDPAVGDLCQSGSPFQPSNFYGAPCPPITTLETIPSCAQGLVCDPVANRCLLEAGSACTDGLLCATGATCVSGFCEAAADCVMYGGSCASAPCCQSLACDSVLQLCYLQNGGQCQLGAEPLDCTSGNACVQGSCVPESLTCADYGSSCASLPCCPDGGWACDASTHTCLTASGYPCGAGAGECASGYICGPSGTCEESATCAGYAGGCGAEACCAGLACDATTETCYVEGGGACGPGVVCANGGVCDGQGECGTCAGYQFSCATAPCCAGYTCDVAALTCLETPGSACAAGDLCANGDTCPVGGGTCAPHATCVAYGEACTGSACCPGLLCDATAHECLVAPGAGCNYLLTCADGYTCDQISQLCDQTE